MALEIARTEQIPSVSVVVIGRNEGHRLKRCLDSIKAMADVGGPVEIIYVDSASTDQSVSLAAGSSVHVVELHPVRPTAALGRNAGWRIARAPYILFLDGDTLLDPSFVAASLSDFQNQRTAVVWGHRRELCTDSSWFNRVMDLDWIYRPGITDFCGGDALFRRSVLEETGGFNEDLIAGEEPELCRRIRGLGYEISHVDRPMTKHDLAITRWNQYFRRASRAGYAYAEVSERSAKAGMPFWEAEARGNRRRALILIGLPLAGLVFSYQSQSVLPACFVLLAFCALLIRTAWKAGWKSKSWSTRLSYAVHSHLQQLPILFGQLQYHWTRDLPNKRGLIEYKSSLR
jgi:glycosyltransferase involved in cell wall biosynthesis